MIRSLIHRCRGIRHRTSLHPFRRATRRPQAERLGDRRLLAVVAAVEPAPNTHGADVSTNISVTLDREVESSSASTNSVSIHSSQRGRLVEAAAAVTTTGSVVSVDPSFDFFPGELVQVTVTAALEGVPADPVASQVWQFRTGVTPGTAVLTDSGQNLTTESNLQTFDVALGDLDADGDLDAYFANNGQPDQVWLNNGGEFTNSGQQLGDHASASVSLGDLDNDGDLDAFVAGFADGNRVLLNDAGVLTDSGQSLGDHAGLGAALGDLDGDGDLDALVANLASGNRVWLNSGGEFTDSGQSLGDHASLSAALGDLDGDGDLDAFIANSGGEANRVWLNESGVFTDGGQELGSSVSQDVALGDLDGDGDLDAFVANLDQSNRVWLNDGGAFSDGGQSLGSHGSSGVSLGDLDGDGDLDAFVATVGNETNRIWLNDSGGFTDSGQDMGGSDSSKAAVGDLDGDGDLDAIEANFLSAGRVLLQSANLTVNALVPTASGFRVEFSGELDFSRLNLYDTQLAGQGGPDLVVTGAANGPIRGSVVIESESSIAFIKTGGPLAPDDYSVTLRSASDGFISTNQVWLDGNGDGVGGDDFAANFTIDAFPANAVQIGLPDFVRGPGQDVNLPADTTMGIPLSISNGVTARSITLSIEYDPLVLQITGAQPGPQMPAGSTVALDTSVAGRVTVQFASPADLPAGENVWLILSATVPADDPSSVYRQTRLMRLQDVVASDAASVPLPSVPDDGLHFVTFFADVSGNGRINAGDASQVARFAALVDTGFAASLLVDPVILSDVSGNGRVNASDASRVARFAALIDVPEIPPVPDGVRITAAGVDRLFFDKTPPTDQDRQTGKVEADDTLGVSPPRPISPTSDVDDQPSTLWDQAMILHWESLIDDLLSAQKARR